MQLLLLRFSRNICPGVRLRYGRNFQFKEKNHSPSLSVSVCENSWYWRKCGLTFYFIGKSGDDLYIYSCKINYIQHVLLRSSKIICPGVGLRYGRNCSLRRNHSQASLKQSRVSLWKLSILTLMLILFNIFNLIIYRHQLTLEKK